MPRVLGEGDEAAQAADPGKEELFSGRVGNVGRTISVTWIERPVNQGSKRGITKSSKRRRKK